MITLFLYFKIPSMFLNSEQFNFENTRSSYSSVTKNVSTHKYRKLQIRLKTSVLHRKLKRLKNMVKFEDACRQFKWKLLKCFLLLK